MSACASCIRRSWLLAQLGGPLDFVVRDRGRMSEVLALADDELVHGLGGRRRAELKARYERFRGDELKTERDVQGVCRHDPEYPAALRTPGAPHMLYVCGGAGTLAQLTGSPVVAIVGSARASDYGMEVAKSLARGLAAAGVTITSGPGDGIALAAQLGALEGGGRTIAVMGGGLAVSCPARRRSLYERLTRRGCAVSELPDDSRGRAWGPAASERIVVGLSTLTVVVEAVAQQRELAAARLAQGLGRTLGAVPGRVSSPLSTGTNALLMEGAHLVREARDALELLYPLATTAPPASATEGPSLDTLAPRLRATLERVGSGCDTPEKLAGEAADLDDAMLALSELELMGLLTRGDGGRYLPRGAFSGP